MAGGMQTRVGVMEEIQLCLNLGIGHLAQDSLDGGRCGGCLAW